MRKLILLLLLAIAASAQTVTPNLDFNLPNPGSRNWGLALNSNFRIVDSVFSSGQCGDATHAVGYNVTTHQLFCQFIPATGVTILPIANGGTGTSTPNLVAGANIIITGAWPNQTINATGGGGGSPPFSVITAGTNTSPLLIGTGGSLGVSGAGTIDSTTLLGSTWASPGSIGITTPAPGAFTSLSSTTTGTFNNLTVTGTCTGCAGSTTAFAAITAGTNTAALVVGTGGSLAATGAGTITATNFLSLTAGTSGGIPYFSGASTLASSTALTANLPVVGGGAGLAPVSGSRTGNTTQFATWTGATTASRCVDTDSSGNLHITAADCGVSSGTVSSVGQTFTGGIISVAGSPITTSGTLALTVAGVSGGIPYFSSSSAWASSATLAAGVLIKGGGIATSPLPSSITDNATLISTTEGMSISPTSTSQVGLIINNPTSTTADILDTEVNGVKQFFVDPTGDANFQASDSVSPSFTLLNNDGSGAPAAPSQGAWWAIYPGVFYFDGSNTQQVATWGQANQFTQSQTIAASSSSNPALTLTAGIGTAGGASSAHAFDINALGGTNMISVCTDTTTCPTPFTLQAPAFATTGTTNGTEDFAATGVDPRTVFSVPANSIRFEAPNTITTSFRVLWPAAKGTNGQVLTTDGCANDADGVPKCTLSFASAGSGVTSIATTSPITGGTITTTGTIACATCATTTNGGALTATAPTTISAAGVIAVSTFVASGGSHASGLVPDPGSSAGTTRFLREDATFAVPSGSSGNSLTQLAKSTNYTAVAGDFTTPSHIVFTCAADCVLTLPSTAPTSGSYIVVQNVSTGNTSPIVLVTPNGLTLNGLAAPILIVSGSEPVIISSNGTNYNGSGNPSNRLPNSRRWSYATGSANNVAINVVGDSILESATTKNSLAPTATEPAYRTLASSTVSGNDASAQGDLNYRTGRNIIAQAKTAPSNITASIGRYCLLCVTDGTAGVMGTSTYASGSGPANTNYAAFVFDSGSALTATNVICSVGNGTTANNFFADTGQAAAADTGHAYEIDFNDALPTPNIIFKIDGLIISGCTRTTNIPAAGVNLRLTFSAHNLTTTSQKIDFAWASAGSTE